MLCKVVSLFKSNLLSVILNVLLIIITAKFLGAEGRGEITIINSISLIIQLINGIVSSGAVFYLLRIHSISELWIASFLWSFVISAFSTLICNYLGFISIDFYFLLFLFSLFSSIQTLQFMLHIHLNQSKVYGIIKVLQPILIIIITFLARDSLNIYTFYSINAATIFLCVCISLIYLNINFKIIEFKKLGVLLRNSLKYGGISQLSNLSQIVNYRFSFFLLETHSGLAAVGIFSIVFSLCEVIWLFSATVSTVICSEISKYNNTQKELHQTKLAFKLVLVITSLLVFATLLLPTNFYVLLLNEEFINLKQYLFYMVPGIVILAGAKVISHYFSALGLMKYNFISSFAGTLVLIPLGLIIINKYGILGAALTNSFSYIVTAFVLFYFFRISIKSLPH